MMNVQRWQFAVVLGVIAALGGCASSYKPSVYQSGQVMTQMRVKLATVTGVRDVEIANPESGAGRSAGTVAGAVAGANPNAGRGGIVGGVAGAVVGGVAGALVDKAVNSRRGIEILYQLDTGETLALVQEADPENPIAVGDRVRILEGTFSARAVRVPVAEAVAGR
jgi:outer membrane lipoprotein SlyB